MPRHASAFHHRLTQRGERPLADLTLFGTREGAETAGFAPCTSCRPDLHPLHA